MTRRRRIAGWAVAVLAALLVVRALLPSFITQRINARMAEMGDYRGQIADVDLALWRGAYAIDDMVIRKRTQEVPVPLLEAPRIDLSLSWGHLLSGALVGEVYFFEPIVNFVDGVGENDQSGRGVNWRDRLEDLFPFRINALHVQNGTVVFRAFDSDAAVDVRATAVEVSARNLTNVEDAEGKRDAELDIDARLAGDATAEVRARFDPFGTAENFELDLRIAQLDLTAINELARAYAGLDMASGHGDFVMELAAEDGELDGYAKPLFKDLEILDWEQDVEQNSDNPVELAWEALSAGVTELFKNREKDQFATRIPIQGSTRDPSLSPIDAILGILRNAFVEAYESRFDSGPSLDAGEPESGAAEDAGGDAGDGDGGGNGDDSSGEAS